MTHGDSYLSVGAILSICSIMTYWKSCSWDRRTCSTWSWRPIQSHSMAKLCHSKRVGYCSNAKMHVWPCNQICWSAEQKRVDMWHESRQSWTSHRRSSFHENHASIPLGLARSTLNLTDVPWWFLILEGMDLCTNGRLFTEVTLWVRAGTAKRLQHPVFLDPWRQMPAIISFQIRAEGTCARAYCVRRFSSTEGTKP